MMEALPLPDQRNQEWTTCCSKSSRKFVIFMTQVALGFSMILFCMLQIMREEDPEKEKIYFTMIGTTAGIFFPHPTMAGDTKEDTPPTNVILTTPIRPTPMRPTPTRPITSRAPEPAPDDQDLPGLGLDI